LGDYIHSCRKPQVSIIIVKSHFFEYLAVKTGFLDIPKRMKLFLLSKMGCLWYNKTPVVCQADKLFLVISDACNVSGFWGV
jgi:hypothetical protein